MMTSRDPYESECFSFMGATTSSEPKTSLADESHDRASMMSPMPGPMAFTVDFGGDDESEESLKKKKLSLRDGIRRFAPSKKKNVSTVTSSPNVTTTVTSSCQVARMVAMPPHTQQQLTNNTNNYANEHRKLQVADPISAKFGISSASRMVVDRENNIQSEIVTRDGPHVPRDLHQASRDAQQALRDTQPRGGGDAASEAGTYTIDQHTRVRRRLKASAATSSTTINRIGPKDDDADGEEEGEEEVKRTHKTSIGEMFSVREDQWSTRDWVDRWASASLPTTAVGDSNDVNGDDDDFDYDDEDSYMSLRDTESGRSRRRLPPTPMKGAVSSNGGTDDCLQDTITLMASMEARLSLEGTDDRLVKSMITPSAVTAADDHRKPRVAQTTATTAGKKNGPSKAAEASAASKANKAAERLAAWQRRKNYDPLKAASNGKVQQAASRVRQSPSHSLTEESFSESCSDLELHGEVAPTRIASDMFSSQSSPRIASDMYVSQSPRSYSSQPPSKSPFATQAPSAQIFSNQSSPRSLNSSKPLPANLAKAVPARPNRAFALRQTNSSSGPVSHPAVERTPSKPDLGRSEGPRFGSASLRPSKSTLTSSSMNGPKKMAPGLVSAVKSGRSTSTLSSKEAEYQAWKRRKNYNPLRSAAAGTSNGSSSVAKKDPPAARQPLTSTRSATTSSSATTASIPGRRMSALDEADGEDNIHRSASFHYPDGLSRVQHNVYTSEDEECEPIMIGSNLYEVNEDELVLAIGRTNSIENGGFHSGRKSGLRSSPSRGSTSRLEALDNLVISTVFSVSTKLCMTSAKLIRRLQDSTNDKEQLAYLDTLLYVLEDVEPPISPSKKTSRELAGTLRNLKKVEQALQTMERCGSENEDM